MFNPADALSKHFFFLVFPRVRRLDWLKWCAEPSTEMDPWISLRQTWTCTCQPASFWTPPWLFLLRRFLSFKCKSQIQHQRTLRTVLPASDLFFSLDRYRWAFVPEVNVNHYSGPEMALIEGEQDCIPHVVRILEGIQLRYGVCGFKTVNFKILDSWHFWMSFIMRLRNNLVILRPL